LIDLTTLQGLTMSIQADTVRNIAHLARLQVQEDEVERYIQILSPIFDLFEQLNQVDTTGVEPMSHSMAAFQRLRDDVVTEANERDDLQKIAPQVEEGLYLVPQVIE
jgi:aspartyl-tRNA(Asn)/glutamyl-tRNA(Gln) amidotransferase subunit C